MSFLINTLKIGSLGAMSNVIKDLSDALVTLIYFEKNDDPTVQQKLELNRKFETYLRHFTLISIKLY